MKAISLPINIFVIVAIAVTISLGVTSLYFIGWRPFSGTTTLEGIKNEACRVLVQEKRCKGYTYEITISNFDANENGVNDPGTTWDWISGTGDDNLAALCYKYYGARSEPACKNSCQCVGIEKYIISPAELHAMGDLDQDCDIDFDDFSTFAAAYGSTPGNPAWNPNCDLDKDGVIDSDDWYLFSGNYGKTCL